MVWLLNTRALANVPLCGFLLTLPNVYGADYEFIRDVNLSKKPQVRIDLGPVKLGEEYWVDLILRNTDDVPMQFREVVLGCKCLDARVPDDATLPGETLKMSVRLKTQGRLKSEVMAEGMALTRGDDESPRLGITFSYTPVAALAFKNHINLIEVNVDQPVLPHFFPVLFTEPLAATDLRLELTGALKDVVVSTTLIKRDNAWGYEVTFDENLNGLSSVVGLLVLSDAAGAARDESNLYVRRPSPIKITPSLLRMFPTDDNRLEGTLILESRVPDPEQERRNPGGVQGSARELPLPRVRRCVLAGTTLRTDCKRVGGRVFRVTVSAPDSLFEDPSSGEIEWSVEHLGTIVDMKTKCVVSAR